MRVSVLALVATAPGPDVKYCPVGDIIGATFVDPVGVVSREKSSSFAAVGIDVDLVMADLVSPGRPLGNLLMPVSTGSER